MKINILNNKNGITPIISILIIVLIVVGASSGFYLFTLSWQEETQKNIEEIELKPNLVLPSYSKELSSVISELYEETHENYIIDQQEAYNKAIIRAVSFGNIKLGIISRNLNYQEKNVYPDLDMNGKKDIGKRLVETQIGYEMVVPIVSKDNLLDNISKDMIMNIYNGNIRNWKFIPKNSTNNIIDEVIELDFDEDEINADPITNNEFTYINNWNFNHILRIIGYPELAGKDFMFMDNDTNGKYNDSYGDIIITKCINLPSPTPVLSTPLGKRKIGINNNNKIFIFGDRTDDDIYNDLSYTDDIGYIALKDEHPNLFFDVIPELCNKVLTNAIIAKCNNTNQYFVFIDNNQNGTYDYQPSDYQHENTINVYDFRNEFIGEAVFCKYLFNLENLAQFEDIYINLDDDYKVESEEEMVTRIDADTNGIGFVSYKYAKKHLDKIKILEYSNNGITLVNDSDIQSWPFKTSLNFITVNNPIGESKSLIDFCLQPDVNLQICNSCNLVSIYD